MTDTSTINIASFIQTSKDAGTNASNKFYANSNNDFANVFENINKSFTDQGGTRSATNNDSREIAQKSNETKTNKRDDNNKVDDNNQNVNKKDSSNDNEKIKSKDENQNKNENNNQKTENKDEKNNTVDKKSETGSKNETNNESASETETKTTAESTTQQSNNETNANIEANAEAAVLAQKTNELNILNSTENIISNLPAVDVDVKTNTNTVQTNENTQNQTISSQVIQDSLNAASNQLEQLAQNSTDKTNQSNLKVQPQTQQALSNVKVDQQEAKVETKTTEQTAQIDAQQLADATIETPLIKVATEAVVADSNTNVVDAGNKQNIKDLMHKTSLTQDMLDKTNAKVVSVSTSNSSNSNNLLNSQNPEEQSIKLSLMGNTNNTSAMMESNQTKFTQTLDGVQTQNNKELNKSEIMSQIYNKLDNLKDEATTKITIVLKPENLGKINLELMNGKDGLTAKMTTDNAQVKELLDKSLNGLKDALASQGVSVNTVTVKVEEAQKQSTSDMFSFDQGQSNTGNQEFSNDSQNQSGFGFGDEIDNVISSTEAFAESEGTESTELDNGKVDYKV